MKLPVIPYGKQEITEADIQAVTEVLKSDFLTQGPKVKEFEDRFAEYVGAKYALATANATLALHLGVLALGVKPKQKVITSPITFVASGNSVLYCGGEIAFADIDPKTLCLDPNRVEDLVKKSPESYRGIIPIDFAGFPIRMDDFKTIADRYGLWIIEDACHAPGAYYTDAKGAVQKTGNNQYSDISIFSFHPVKHIATGEGGMITTNNRDLYKKIQLLRTHGITKDPKQMNRFDGDWYHEMHELGFNYRISDVLCALGISQLSRADQALARRKEIAKRYDTELAGLPIRLPYSSEKNSHAYHLYVIQTEKRKELFSFMKEKGIAPQVHYIPVYQQPYYVQRYGKQHFENAEKYYQGCLSIPLYHSMTNDEQTRVIEAIKNFFK